MKHIKISKNIAYLLYSFLFVLTIVIAGLLCMQYRYFKQETQELEQVKDSYYQHIEMLKRSLNASLTDSSDEPDLESDKKKNNIMLSNNGAQLTIVDTAYHKKSEQEFSFISLEEENQLILQKEYLRNVSKPKNVFRKKVIKKTLPKMVKQTERYGPKRDFIFHWPVDISKFWLSSLYGPRKLSSGQVSFHHAIDMAALKGTPVKAAAAGKVIMAQNVVGYGNCVLIEHNHRYRTRYAHLDTIAVRVGQTVAAGYCIGTVGDSGYVRKSGRDASHLHFEIYQDGIRINPLKYLF